MALTAAAAAAALAAEEPRPEPKGRPFSKERESPTERIPRSFMAAMAEIPAQLRRGSLESFLEDENGPEISEMESCPGWMVGSTVTETKSPRPSTAQPRKSKPGPRLATVAGAKARAEVRTGSGSATRGAEWGLEEREKLQMNGDLLRDVVEWGLGLGLA